MWISIFVRAPNILSLLLLFAIPIYFLYFEKKSTLHKSWKFISWYISIGVLWWIAWVILLIITIYSFGHWQYFIQSLIYLLETGTSEWHHSISGLLMMYLRSYIFIALVGAAWLISTTLIERLFQGQLTKMLIMISLWFTLWVISIMKFEKHFPVFWVNLFGNYYAFIIPFLITYIGVFIIFKSKMSLRFLVALSLPFMFIWPAWSWAYIDNMRFASILFLPILIEFASLQKVPYLTAIIRLTLVSVLWWAIPWIYGNTYMDSNNRLELHEPISCYKSEWILTTKVSGREISKLCHFFSQNPWKKTILTLWDMNYLASVTDNIPYLPSSSTEYISFETFKKIVEEKIEAGIYPDYIVIRREKTFQEWHKKIEDFLFTNLIHRYNLTYKTPSYSIYTLWH